MMGFLFGARKSPWEPLGSAFREHVTAVLSPSALAEVERVVTKHRVLADLGQSDVVMPEENEMRARAVSLLICDKHFQLISRNASQLRSENATSLINASLLLNNEAWNPAWTWHFYYEAKNLPADRMEQYLQLALGAFDTWADWYPRLLGRPALSNLAPSEVRALPLYLHIEKRLADSLSADDLAVLSSVLMKEVDGVPVKKTVMNLLSGDPRESAVAAEHGLRVIAHTVHLFGQQTLFALNFQAAHLLERCAAAINDLHLPSRFDLALMLRDFDSADPGKGHLAEAKVYAQQALDLADSGHFDIGPPHNVGEPPPSARESISDLREKMREILASASD